MSLGTVLATRTRGLPVEAIIKHYDLDVKIDTSYENHPEFKAAFPLEKYPVFIGPKGFKLSEAFAISLYRMYHN